MAPEHQLLYLHLLCNAAKASADKAREAVAKAELTVADGAESGWTLGRLRALRRLQQEAVQRLQSFVVHGRLYLAALKQYRASMTPSAAWDEGMR